MTTPAQHATALAAAIASFDAGTYTQTQLANALTEALNAYDDVGGLQSAIRALLTSNETLLASVRFFEPSGSVESVDDLPTGRPNGEYWIITAGPSDGHGYLRAGTQWVDMGPVRGPTGLTPVLGAGTIAALEPDATPTMAISGTAEEPLLHLGLPRGRNALHGISLSVAYRMEAGEILAIYVSTSDERFDPTQTLAISQTTDTVERVITIRQGSVDGDVWGTLTWSPGQTAAAIDIPDPNNPTGGVLIFQGPAGADCSLANIAIHLPGAAS